MWQDIERISGLPFPQRSPAGVDSDLYARTVETSLAYDFDLVSPAHDVDQAETQQLQQDLLHVTNHATAVEIEAGNERERNQALSQSVTCLEAENVSLQDNVSELRKNLDIHTCISSKEKENLLSRVRILDNELSQKNATVELLRSEHSKMLQELDGLKLQNVVYEERITALKDNLNNTTQTSQKRESRAIILAQTEAKHCIKLAQAEAKENNAVLEAKLQSVEEQLEKAENREQQASALAQEMRQEARNALQKMNDDIVIVNKETSSLHSAEIERARKEIEKVNVELESVRQELQHANIILSKQSETFSKSLNKAEYQTRETNTKLENQTAQCDQLQTELEQCNEAKELVLLDAKSLNAEVEYLQKIKDESEESRRTLKNTLENERHQHASIINDLESNIVESIREKFSSSQIK